MSARFQIRVVVQIFGPPVHHAVALRATGFRRVLSRVQDPAREVTLDPELACAEDARQGLRCLLVPGLEARLRLTRSSDASYRMQVVEVAKGRK